MIDVSNIRKGAIYTVPEAAELLGTSDDTVLRRIREKRIRAMVHVTTGNYRIMGSELIRYARTSIIDIGKEAAHE